MGYAVPREEGAHIQILTAFLADGGLISGLNYGITKGARLELRLVVLGTRRGGGLVAGWGTGRRDLVCTMPVDGFAQSGITGSTEAKLGVFDGACGGSEPLSLFNNCNMACPMNAPHRNGGRWVHEASAIDPREK
ncbi:hypothetical protein V500_10436 [Pseudogymnoascus sp. VKM F-4518 (FW-2643)]|nr:hypothetical protein V500_10436 [Pseudogymnoascus sp. VKM F-4518 (FW-2643)]